MSHAAPPILSVRDLTVRFAQHDAVSAFSFDIAAGETLAIVGESGSGKSMTALSIPRLLPPGAVVSGGITLDGADILALDGRGLRAVRGGKVGVVFQEPMTSLNPLLRVGQQVGEALRVHQGLSRKAARVRATELLDIVRIPQPDRRYDAYPHELSGGLRQRVMIAIAIACAPRLLIADEPTTALDVTIQAQILELLDSLRRELSMAVLLISHDLDLVGQWADRVIVLYAGRKMEEGPARDVLTAPVHPYTRGLLAASPRHALSHHYTDGPLREIPGSIASARGQAGCAFAPRCSLARPACRVSVPEPVAVERHRVVACPVVAEAFAA